MNNVSIPYINITKVIILTLLFTLANVGCVNKSIKGTNVNSNSEVFTGAAKSLQGACSNPAEFGRCGCRLDGISTSCDIVSRCLVNGFCVVARE